MLKALKALKALRARTTGAYQSLVPKNSELLSTIKNYNKALKAFADESWALNNRVRHSQVRNPFMLFVPAKCEFSYMQWQLQSLADKVESKHNDIYNQLNKLSITVNVAQEAKKLNYTLLDKSSEYYLVESLSQANGQNYNGSNSIDQEDQLVKHLNKAQRLQAFIEAVFKGLADKDEQGNIPLKKAGFITCDAEQEDFNSMLESVQAPCYLRLAPNVASLASNVNGGSHK